VREVAGDGRLERVTIEHTSSGQVEVLDASAMFIFIGASPHTRWLPPHIATDDLGFVLTGPALGDRRFPSSSGERDPYLYETSVPGVFAVGDVRARSVKRVASAVGEGAVAVQLVHEYLRG
jgi:thioredoxin reductase (NADPH)